MISDNNKKQFLIVILVFLTHSIIAQERPPIEVRQDEIPLNFLGVDELLGAQKPGTTILSGGWRTARIETYLDSFPGERSIKIKNTAGSNYAKNSKNISISVDSLVARIFKQDKFYFSNGCIFIVKKDKEIGSTQITGDVTNADLVKGKTGYDSMTYAGASSSNLGVVNSQTYKTPRTYSGNIVKMNWASIGSPIVSRNVSYSLGSNIKTPSVDENGNPLTETNMDYWREKPHDDFQVLSASIMSRGTLYGVGEIVTIPARNGEVSAQFRVTRTQGNGEVSEIELIHGGKYHSKMEDAVEVLPGQINAREEGLEVKIGCKYETIGELPVNVYAQPNVNNGRNSSLEGNENGILPANIFKPALNNPKIGDRILIKDQSDYWKNGIYTLTASGSNTSKWKLTRSSDFDEESEIYVNAFTLVNNELGRVCVAKQEVIFSKGQFSGVDFEEYKGNIQTSEGSGLKLFVDIGHRDFYWSSNANKLYAIEPGLINISWIRNTPVNASERKEGINYYNFPAGSNYYYALLEKNYVVSNTTSKPTKKIYWTENNFSGPKIKIPNAEL